MSNVEARISLQRSRFSLIQEAADFNSEVSHLTRQLIITRMEMLDQNWAKFQEEHENLCLSESDALSEQPYLRERIYESCHAFYVYSRAKLLTQRDEIDASDRHSRSTLSEHGASVSMMPCSALPRIKFLWRLPVLEIVPRFVHLNDS